MKKLILSLAFFGAMLVSKAQAPSNIVAGSWQNAAIRADGQTSVNGVEPSCMKVTCNNEEFIVVKFKNTNNYIVAVEWKDGIYYNGVWNSGTLTKKLYINPNSEAIGDCNGDIKLKVNINSIVNLPAGSGHYATMGLTVSQ